VYSTTLEENHIWIGLWDSELKSIIDSVSGSDIDGIDKFLNEFIRRHGDIEVFTIGSLPEDIKSQYNDYLTAQNKQSKDLTKGW